MVTQWLAESGPMAAEVGLVGSLILIRTLPVVLFVPIFGGQFAAIALRVGVAIGLAAALAPTVAHAWGVGAWPAVEPARLAARETLVGTSIGLLLALTFYGAAMAGQVIDGVRGHTRVYAIGTPESGREGDAARLLLLLTIVLYMGAGAHHSLIRSIAHSFEVVPVLSPPALTGATGDVLLGLIVAIGGLFVIALEVALPVIVAVLLADVVLGVASRLAPRLHAYFMGLPARSLLGLLVLLLSLSAGLSRLLEEGPRGLHWVDWLLETVGGPE